MADVKRWSVTYTKHVKQKRKVYQDGFLELHESSRKVKLYDDCEKLLQISFLKKEDLVGSGETLTLEAYLVDIGDIEGHRQPENSSNVKGCGAESRGKSGSFPGKKMDYFAATNVNQCRRKKVPLHNLSPSQKLIGEFKKNERNKYEAPLRSPETIKTTYNEWQVLYTTQKTQKAKKYHDGIIRVTISGSQGRQLMLYDLSRTLLDSKFLKKDEMIQSGESLTLDGHLVDIGERQGEHDPLNLKVKDCSSSNGQQAWHNNGVVDNIQTTKLPEAARVTREWHVLYTSQITQKAKKYHCGILRLASCNSYQMQATLLDEVGNILSRKFLKSSEDVRSDSTFGLSNYLVEVGDPITILEGKPPKHEVSDKKVQLKSTPPNIDHSRMGRVAMEKPTCDRKPQICNFSEKEVELKSNPLNISNSTMGRGPVEKPIRDANEILSVLRKFSNQEGKGAIKRAYTEQCDTAGSKFIQSDIQIQSQVKQEHDKKRTRPDHLGEAELKQSLAALPDISEMEIAYAADSEIRRASHFKYCTPSSSSPGSGASDVSCTTSGDSLQKDEIILKSVSSAEEPQPKQEYPDFPKAPTKSLRDDKSNTCVDAASTCHGDQLSDKMSAGVTLQHNDTEDNSGIHSKCEETDDTRDAENSSGCISSKQNNTIRNSSGVDKSMKDDLPSFDLGF